MQRARDEARHDEPHALLDPHAHERRHAGEVEPAAAAAPAVDVEQHQRADVEPGAQVFRTARQRPGPGTLGEPRSVRQLALHPLRPLHVRYPTKNTPELDPRTDRCPGSREAQASGRVGVVVDRVDQAGIGDQLERQLLLAAPAGAAARGWPGWQPQVPEDALRSSPTPLVDGSLVRRGPAYGQRQRAGPGPRSTPCAGVLSPVPEARAGRLCPSRRRGARSRCSVPRWTASSQAGQAPVASGSPDRPDDPDRARRLDWARLLARTFSIDVCRRRQEASSFSQVLARLTLGDKTPSLMTHGTPLRHSRPCRSGPNCGHPRSTPPRARASATPHPAGGHRERRRPADEAVPARR